MGRGLALLERLRSRGASAPQRSTTRMVPRRVPSHLSACRQHHGRSPYRQTSENRTNPQQYLPNAEHSRCATRCPRGSGLSLRHRVRPTAMYRRPRISPTVARRHQPTPRAPLPLTTRLGARLSVALCARHTRRMASGPMVSAKRLSEKNPSHQPLQFATRTSHNRRVLNKKQKKWPKHFVVRAFFITFAAETTDAFSIKRRSSKSNSITI